MSLMQRSTTLRITLLSTSISLTTEVFAGHPLLTEDTATQGRGNAQVELTYERSQLDDAGTREVSRDTSLVLSYGSTDPFDIILVIPHSRQEATGAPTVSGMGDVELAAKWRFYENEAWSFALRPGVTFATGDEVQGLGTGKGTASVFAIMSYVADPWGFHMHAGITDNRNVVGERQHIIHFSAAATRRLTDKFQLVADVSHDTNTDIISGEHIESAVLGLVYCVSDRVDLDMGYRSGITASAADGTWLLGIAMRF
jgi:Putative MetA-pathway of phenol degradation